MTTSLDALQAARNKILAALADRDKGTAAAVEKIKKIFNWCVQASSPRSDEVTVDVKPSDNDRSCLYALRTPDGRVRAHLAFVVDGTSIKVSRVVQTPWHQTKESTLVTNLDPTVPQDVVDRLIIDFLQYVSTPPASNSAVGGIMSADDFPDDGAEE